MLTAAGLLIAGIITCCAVLILVPAYTLDNVYAFSLKEERLRFSTEETGNLHPEFTVLRERGVSKVREEFAQSKVKYGSSDETVVKVSDTGEITCLKEGSADITASWDLQSAVCHVDSYVAIKDISFRHKIAFMNVFEETDLQVDVYPENATLYEGVTFKNLTPELAEMDDEGHVTVKKPGTARFSFASHGFTGETSIVIYSPLTGITFSGEEEITLVRGESLDFSYEIIPEDTTDAIKAVYEVSDETLGSIDENGHFTALQSGDVTVGLTVNQFSAESLIHIIVPLERIDLSFEALTIRAQDAIQMQVSYLPEDTTEDRTIIYTSSDPNIVSVSETGVVTALNAGTAVVTAACGEHTAQATFTVVIPVTGVVISEGSAVLNKGTTHQISASVIPENTTEERYISWSSDNINVATVDNGVITAVGPGTANIIAAHDDFIAICTVTVLSPITDIVMDIPSLTLYEGAASQLNVIYLPEDTTDERWVMWESTNPGIAVVNNGMVSALSQGECDIIAYRGDLGTKTHVTVLPYIHVQSVNVDRREIAFGGPGEQVRLNVSVQPENATSRAVAFSSSNPAIASVTADGVVTSGNAGNCVITVSSGNVAVQVQVSVAAVVQNVVVMLDPGHDGIHTGANYYGVLEHNANLRVSLTCKAYLESHYQGVTVLMTHSDASCPVGGADLKQDLEHRAQMAQNAGAAILVSQHFNVSAGHSASGCVAYISKEPNVYGQCAALANNILAQISGMFGLTNRGCETANSNQYFDSYGNPLDYYAINRHAANRGIPGIIVEHCFMDHPSDMVYLTSVEYLDRFGIADAIGIANYLGLAPR